MQNTSGQRDLKISILMVPKNLYIIYRIYKYNRCFEVENKDAALSTTPNKLLM